MQRSQVFKVKGMLRDLSMPNANGEFAYDIINMRLMPAEEGSGFSLTNEKGTSVTGITLNGQVIGQCPTNDSLVVFTTSATYNEYDERTGGFDYIYEIYQTPEGRWTAGSSPLYEGDLNFHADNPIEALFNYETEDIQKVYWIDGINQLRCINLVGEIQEDNNQQFDSVKEINSLPSVEIERVIGGSFTAGVIQYYVTYFNKNSSESPIVYTSPLLYIAHDNRGANVNDQVSTAFKLTLTDLDTDNWEYMRIYVTHRTSIDATPEASIVAELNMNNSTIEFTDYGSNRTSIVPTDLYFIGGKFVKAGTMTVKDQVMFLGNLNIETPETVSVVEIQHLFDSIRDNEDHPFTTTTRKTKENKLEEYEDTHYYYKNQLNNTESITHYKYGEKYRFGISVLDKYGNWSNPIWIKDAFIEVPPEQVDKDTLELPCPSLDLSYSITYNNETKPLLEHLQNRGAISIKPIVVFPKEDERKVIAQGVVCPTVYNLKDRTENGPYAQASWFMRPNAPVDLWGIDSLQFGKSNIKIAESEDGKDELVIPILSHKSDIQLSFKNSPLASYYGINIPPLDTGENLYNNGLTAFDYMYDDVSSVRSFYKSVPYSKVWTLGSTSQDLDFSKQKEIVSHGNWTEFRHNYALRTKGWSFGAITSTQTWGDDIIDDVQKYNHGMVRGAEIDPTKFGVTRPTNRFGISTQFNNLEKDGKYIQLGTTDYWSADHHYTGRPIEILLLYLIPETKKFILLNTIMGTEIVETLDNGTIGHGYRFVYKDKTYTSDLWTQAWFPPIYYPGLTYQVSLDATHFPIEKLTTLINDMYPDGIIISGGTDIESYYPDDCTFSNSAYYIDSSIITLNSPEIELQSKNWTTHNLNFRILGCIPLTATTSDIYLKVDDPASYPQSGEYGKTGLYKSLLQNKNIGYHGFKGTISTNAYFNYYELPEIGAYGMVPLYPWNSVGTLLGSNTDTDVKSKLNRKILSNLRFSASTYYFPKDMFSLDSDSEESYAFLNGKKVGWKPAYGQEVAAYTDTETTSILKFKNLKHITSDAVYRGSTSSEGSLAGLTVGIAEVPSNSFIYRFAPNTLVGLTSPDPEVLLYSPAIHYATSGTDKTGISAPIIYKSSPHFVVSFNAMKLKNKDLWMQETLPTWRTLNEEGLPKDYLTSNTGSLEHGHQFKNEKLSSLYHQSYLKCTTDELNLGLPGFVPSRQSVISYGEYTEKWILNIQDVDTMVILPNGSSSSIYWKPTDFISSYLTLDNSSAMSIKIEGVGLENFQEDINHWHSSTINCTISITNDFFDILSTKVNDMSVGDEYTWNENTGIKVTLQTSYNQPNPISAESCQVKIEKRSSSTAKQYLQLTVAHPYGTDQENRRFRIILDKICISKKYIPYEDTLVPNYGWLWLGEIYRESDPVFGGTSEHALQSNQWENAGNSQIIATNLDIEPYYEIGILGNKQSTWFLEGGEDRIEYSSVLAGCRIDINNPTQTGGFEGIKVYSNSSVSSDTNFLGITGVEYNFCIIKNSTLYSRILTYLNQLQNRPNSTLEISFGGDILSSGIIAFEDKPLIVYETTEPIADTSISEMTQLILTGTNSNGTVKCSMSIICSGSAITISYTVHDIIDTTDSPLTLFGTATTPEILQWTSGDTYYQRFDTLKTYAYSDSDKNSVIDITSFMVETRINIDGRTDRNRGQESNLQMSPTNFNLMNDVYSQRDNFFTYRILDEDLQARTNFPNQITWSLTKTAGATIDAWMNITLANVLDLDGTKGKLTALKTFNNHIIALQESGVSEILFNSRVQIPTSESVPIQIANSGKVDGQQYFTNKLGCQDKWTIVDTTSGLYWVDYNNKVIYKFNGQVEDLSTPKGFRGWCEKNITSSSQIRGYYDNKNREIMFCDANFSSVNDLSVSWLGFSELTNAFSSFYTYPEARLVSFKDTGLWLYGNQIYEHQKGEYNYLLDGYHPYGLTGIVRQDSNLVKTFNNVEFRADTYLNNSEIPEERKTFDTIQIEDEYNGPTSAPLEFKPYRPSNLKKYLRTWRANIPRVNNKYKRYVNQWAKVGLWTTKPSSEKTILHDMAVWYSE